MGFQLRGFDEREGATWQPGKTLRCFVLSSSPSLLLLLLTLLLMLLLLPSLLVPIRSAVLAAEEARPTWISNKPAVSVIDEGNAAEFRRHHRDGGRNRRGSGGQHRKVVFRR